MCIIIGYIYYCMYITIVMTLYPCIILQSFSFSLYFLLYTHRAVHVLPNQELGTFGEHTAGFPINGMCLTHDHAWVVTSSYNCCHFWPQGDIPKLPLGKGEGGGGEGGDGGRSGRRKRKRKQKQRDLEDVEKVKQSRDDFFSDLCN